MSLMESDLRRMIGNAKSFNQKSSPVFSDAEKMRKTVAAFMTTNNPAYKTGNYVPGPTPIPEGWQARLEEEEGAAAAGVDVDAEGETDHEETPQQTKSVTPPPSPPPAPARKQRSTAARSTSVNTSKDPRASTTPAVQDAEGAGESFDGDTFQQAQEKIITEMINLKNDEFVSKPSIPTLPI